MQFDLDSMDERDIEALISEAKQVLENRKAERRQKAIDTARQTLEAAGLTFSDVARLAASGGRKRTRRSGSSEPAKQYVHPDNPEQVWTAGRGRPPKWVKKLQARDAEQQH